MDPTRFDRLTKSLGTARSHRGVLTALGGAVGERMGVLATSGRNAGQFTARVSFSGTWPCSASGGRWSEGMRIAYPQPRRTRSFAWIMSYQMDAATFFGAKSAFATGGVACPSARTSVNRSAKGVLRDIERACLSR